MTTRTIPPLRQWQQAALELYRDKGYPDSFLTVATPGAGKTLYAFATAADLWESGRIRRTVVVTPTDHLRNQWVEAADRAGFDLRATPNDERLPADADGVVATYAQVARAPAMFRGRSITRPTLVIFDEIHHAGDDRSWGSAVTDAFEDAAHRLLLTGTPFRSDDAAIPGVRYEPGPDGTLVSRPDYAYGYADALRDGVVRPVMFAAYRGETSWRNRAGDVEAAILGDATLTRRIEEQAWKTALAPDGEWLGHVFSAAHARCQELRDSGRMPDAAVLVLAADQAQARAYADVWRAVTGQAPLLILSDDPDASAAIVRLRDDPSITAAIAVRMVTEGVDVPRLGCLVYATPASTPLFFAQAVGRVVRARRRGEAATVFLPAVTRLLGLAADLEEQRDHVLPAVDELDDSTLEPPARLEPDTPDEQLPSWTAVSSQARFDRVIAASTSAPADAGEGGLLPMLLTPEQEAALLQRRDADAAAAARAAAKARAASAERSREAEAEKLKQAQWDGTLSEHREYTELLQKQERRARAQATKATAAELRTTIHNHVMRIVGRTGSDPRQVWAEVYRQVPGPKNAQASVKTLRSRLVVVEELAESPGRF